jgi:solute carrier family 25 (adenine nucleotide translocator) protein 4/5/6/31
MSLFPQLNSLPSRSFVSADAPKETKSKNPVGFYEDFLLGGMAAGISKTVAAPIERVKLLVQNQDEMIKSGRLATPYKGVSDCFSYDFLAFFLEHFFSPFLNTPFSVCNMT